MITHEEYEKALQIISQYKEQVEGWTPVEQPPENHMKVKWLYTDGTEDVGFYYKEHNKFASWDFKRDLPITHWKPFESVRKNKDGDHDKI